MAAVRALQPRWPPAPAVINTLLSIPCPSPVMAAASTQSPRAGNRGPSGVTNNTTRHRADGPKDDRSRKCAQGCIAYALSSLRTQRHKPSGDYHTGKYIIHVVLPRIDARYDIVGLCQYCGLSGPLPDHKKSVITRKQFRELDGKRRCGVRNGKFIDLGVQGGTSKVFLYLGSRSTKTPFGLRRIAPSRAR